MIRRIAAPGVTAAAAVVAVTFGIAFAQSGPDGSDGSGGLAGIQAPANQPSTVTSTSDSPSAAPPSLSLMPGETGASGKSGGALAPASTPPTCTSQPPPEQHTAALTRLGDVLAAAVGAQLPQAQFTAGPVTTWQNEQIGPLEFFHVADPTLCQKPYGYYLAYATATDAQGSGQLTAVIERAGVAGDCSLFEAGGEAVPEMTSCTTQAGPDGEAAVLTVLVIDGGVTIHRVDMVKPDGSMVTVAAQNGHGKSGAPTRPTPHLTLSQLFTIALDAGFVL